MSETIGKIDFQFSKVINNQEVFVADETIAQKFNLGRLFVILLIDSKEKNLTEKIKDLIALIENSYYSSPIADMESALELTCQEVNNNLQEIFDKPDAWYQKFNLLIGVVKNNNLVLSQMGAFSGYLTRQKKISQILTSKDIDKEKKYFSQLITGEIKAQDNLVIANYALFDYFSLDKIKEVLANLKINQVIEHFKNLLSDNVKNNNIVGVIIKGNGLPEENIVETQTDKYIQEFYGSKESLKQLENLEQRTGRTLASSNWPDFLKFGKKIILHLGKPFSFLTKKTKELKLPEIKGSSAHLKKGVFKEKIYNFGRVLKNVFRKIFANKIFFRSLVILLIALFLGSVGYLAIYKKTADLHKKWQATLDLAMEKKTASDTALIYEDKEKANNFLNEALSELNNNYPTDKTWQEKFENQKKEIIVLLNKLNNIFDGNLEIVVEIESLNSGAIKNLWKNKGVWQFLTENNEIYGLDNNKNFNLLLKGNNLKQVVLHKDAGLVLLNNDNKFFYLENGKDALKNLTITLATGVAFNDFSVYGDNIYGLDNANGAINKIAQILATKPVITNWYTGNKDLLKSAKEMNVDGNVWLINNNKIIKLYKGKEEAFELGKINQALGNNLELYSEIDWPYLYILDKDNGRIIIINKENGAVARQYLNNDLKQVNNLVVDDLQNNAMMILDKRIYKMGIK